MAKDQGFDLASLDLAKPQEDGTDVAIKHPVTDQPIGLTIRVAGYESERVKRAQRRIANASLKAQRRKLNAEAIEENTLVIAAAAVISWRFDPGVTIDGATPECTPESAKELFRRFPWIGEQVDAVAGDRAAFLPT